MSERRSRGRNASFRAHLDPANAVTYYSLRDPRVRSGPQTRPLTEEDGAWRSSTW